MRKEEIGLRALQYLASLKPAVAGKVAKIKPTPKQEVEVLLQAQADELANILRSGEGFSLNPQTGSLVDLGTQRGFMMSPIPNANAVQFPFNPNITGADILSNLPASYIPRLQRGANLGAWIENNLVYLDPAERYLTRLEALRAGVKSGQLTGADLSKDINNAFFDVTPEALQEAIQRAAKLRMAGLSAGTAVGIPAYIGFRD